MLETNGSMSVSEFAYYLFWLQPISLIWLFSRNGDFSSSVPRDRVLKSLKAITIPSFPCCLFGYSLTVCLAISN